MTLLVLGSSGKVGRLLMQSWSHKEPSVIWHARAPMPWADWVWDGTGDVPEATFTDEQKPIDAVLALWGVVPPQPDLAMNRALALRAIEVAERLGAGRVLLASSAAVYPRSETPHHEEGPLGPFSPYGRAKLDMERAVARYDGPVQTCCMRIGNVVGADSLWPALVAGQVKLDRFEDGRGPLRSYVTAQDLAASIEALAHVDDLPKHINIASPGPVYMEDLALAVQAKITWTQAPATATSRVVLDTSLLDSLVTLAPKSASQMILQTPL